MRHFSQKTRWFASASGKDSNFVPSTKVLQPKCCGFFIRMHLSSKMKRGHELDRGGLPSAHKTIKTSFAITKKKKYWSPRGGMRSRRVLEAVNHIVHHVYLCVKGWGPQILGSHCATLPALKGALRVQPRWKAPRGRGQRNLRGL